MKTKVRVLVTSALLWCVLATAGDYPSRIGYVSDFAGLFDESSRTLLDAELRDFRERTGYEIEVVTVQSLGGDTVENYAVSLAKSWGLGEPGRKACLVLLNSQNERKLTIRTASQARQVIPDATCKSILDTFVKPEFKAGRGQAGLIAGAHALMEAFATVPAEVPAQQSPISQSDSTEPRPTMPATRPQVSVESEVNSTIVIIVFLSILALTGIAGLIMHLFSKQQNAEQYAQMIAGLRDTRDRIQRMLDDKNVNDETRRKALEAVSFINTRLHQLDRDTVTWSKQDKEIAAALLARIESLEDRMVTERNYARKARAEAPKLLKELPERIKEAEHLVKKGKCNAQVIENLETAKANLREARKYEDDQSTNWLILYSLLSDAHDRTTQAVEQYRDDNAPVPVYSSNASGFSSTAKDSGDSPTSQAIFSPPSEPSSPIDTSSSIDTGGGGASADY